MLEHVTLKKSNIKHRSQKAIKKSMIFIPGLKYILSLSTFFNHIPRLDKLLTVFTYADVYCPSLKGKKKEHLTVPVSIERENKFSQVFIQ
jgi:hypothetical protein